MSSLLLLTTSYSTLADLPTELLLIIFRYSRSNTLLNIAKTCHRLNLIAIPVFMKRMGFPDPQTCCVIKPNPKGYADQLTALTINFPLVTIEQLFCVLTNKDHATRISYLTRNIRRVNQLITRLSSIRSISLVIDLWSNRWSLRQSGVQEFTVAVCDLVETSILKSCTSFLIVHSHPATMDTNYKFELVKASAEPKVERFRRLLVKRLSFKKPDDAGLQGDSWKYRKLFTLKTIPRSIMSPIPLHSKLTELDISSDFLLIPPFSTWTFGVMKSSAITSLTLSFPTLITKEEFCHYLFPRLIASLPKLQEIKLAIPRIEFLTTIVEGLPLLPLLRAITFGLSYFGQFHPIPFPLINIGLPWLVSFTGSSEQAAYLFGRTGISFPSLEFVNIIIDMHFQYKPDYWALAERFAILNTQFSEKGISPCISVCLANRELHDELVSIVRSNEENRKWFQHFYTVSRLTLQLPSFSPNTEAEITDQIDRVLAWLDIFRGLKALTLVDRCTVDHLPPERRRAAILAAINAEHPNIVLFNIVDLPSNPDKYHYHWANARSAWERGTDGIPTMPFFLHKSLDTCVCSHF